MMRMIQGWLRGENLVALWVVAFVVVGIVAAVVSGYLKARKIQPKGFSWKTFRGEALFAVIGIVTSGLLIGGLQSALRSRGLLVLNPAPAAWWMIALEYVAYVVAFDTWFYWFHRWMHSEPMYTGIHKLHHLSTSPNLLTTLSVSPLESLINGGSLPIFLAGATVLSLPIHAATMAFIGPTAIIMGLYVHSGYEFLPRWWNKSWLTKWFITTTFHDQHHKYFNYNFGGYTTVWDYICGTNRAKYEADFEAIKARPWGRKAAAAPVASEPEAVAAE